MSKLAASPIFVHYVACIFLVKIQAGLNKGEARNALARAVFMHRLGLC
ncbi:Tn3 family transposase [Cronobacter sakazakii]|uniref:Tn3 family transposase n=1 Tax=Cronobacter sakazakii TaxID=28141 RepID=A0AAN5X395_CROSK|nr:hypothetical protein [Cronobacter sakazakii]KAB0878688.1 Tn3 family transposase [Cronobacter sakazakii]